MSEPAVQLRKICFIRTGSPDDVKAFVRTLTLCEWTKAELRIVRVVEVLPLGILRLISSFGGFEDIVGGEDDSAWFIDQARQQGTPVRFEQLQGPESLAVIRHVQEEGYDLVVKAAQPSTAIHQLLFGHADHQLVRKCPCPVWIEKPSDGGSYKRILAAVDPEPFSDNVETDPIRAELNRSILQWGALVAEHEQAQLHVVHVWRFYFEGLLKTRAHLTPDAAAAVRESFKQKHEQALAELLAPFMEQISRVHLIQGNPPDEIARLASHEAFDLVVMGTVCRTGIAGWLIGNTAETVLNQIECSVVALKPPGFVSPVSAD